MHLFLKRWFSLLLQNELPFVVTPTVTPSHLLQCLQVKIHKVGTRDFSYESLLIQH